MASARTQDYTDAQNELAQLARALAHPGRIMILQHLIEVNACMGNDIVDKLPLAQPTISRHLRELKEGGLIHGEIEGNHTCYCIRPEGWARAKSILALLMDSFKLSDCC